MYVKLVLYVYTRGHPGREHVKELAASLLWGEFTPLIQYIRSRIDVAWYKSEKLGYT